MRYGAVWCNVSSDPGFGAAWQVTFLFFLSCLGLPSLYVIVGGAKSTTLSPDASITSSAIHTVESSPSAMFHMPARVPYQKDWTPDDSLTCCEECQALFSLVRVQIFTSYIQWRVYGVLVITIQS